ncbi:hypothetical protein HK098_000048 [Nowakowskiella sp. JEL0407]|nr:hypothetical protein HK098_000048 [Nowakowskiella sp. JEL0407]
MFGVHEKTPNLAADRLRKLLTDAVANGECLKMPCAYDPLSARLVEKAGFKLTFMTGYGVSAVKGFPDTGLLSFAEMCQSGREITSSINIPCIGDGDTGYGNSVNIRRTVQEYAKAGLAGIMIEDQVSPKKCGHTKNKAVIDRKDAIARVQAAVDARNEGQDIFIIARTDARIISLEEAVERCRIFKDIGADMTFLEAPQSEEEMRYYCEKVPGWKLANMLEGGKTPILSPTKLQEMGYTVAAYPLTLLSACINAMQKTLVALSTGDPEKVEEHLLPFSTVCDVVGFNDYYKLESRYSE